MKPKKDHPGVYPPPPLFYASTFFLSIFSQKLVPLPVSFFKTSASHISGLVIALSGMMIILPALLKFLKTKNTLITIKPANSLQTSGIYAFSRNPMYLGLLLIYSGLALIKGNLWTVLFIPVVILIVNQFVIINEEKYLDRTFGEAYSEYKKSVRRWI